MQKQQPLKTDESLAEEQFLQVSSYWCSLLYPCFKTALCYGVVSGCFVHGVSPSSRFRPELAPKRGLEGPELAFRTPENARKVHAKSSGP